MDKIKRIYINIWDDYYDDGYVPKGEIQETYMYVEDFEISHHDEKNYLTKINDYIKNNLKLDDVLIELFFYESKTKYPVLADEYQFSRWELRFKHLTHERRELLLQELIDANLSYDGIPYYIYSES